MRTGLAFLLMGVTWLVLAAPLLAADPIIVRDNLFSPERRPESLREHEEPVREKAEEMGDDAILLKGVSIHGERRLALLLLQPHLVPDTPDAGPESRRVANAPHGNRAPRSSPRRGRSRGKSGQTIPLLMQEGERVGDVVLNAVYSDHVIILHAGRRYRVELRPGTDDPQSSRD